MVTTLFLELRIFPRVVLLYISNILRRESVGLLGDGVERKLGIELLIATGREIPTCYGGYEIMRKLR